jgi:palmitoyltransferase
LFTQTWYHYYGTGLEPKVNLTIWTLLLIMFALGLAIGVVLAVGALLFFQVKL